MSDITFFSTKITCLALYLKEILNSICYLRIILEIQSIKSLLDYSRTRVIIPKLNIF
jgi:hypothetical protein